MKSYELTVLVRQEADIETVTKLVEEFKGKVANEHKWGKRDLAYAIKKETAAFYFTYQLELDPSQISEFKKKMNYDEKVLRYLLLSRN